ncbi:DoxX family protein [Streptomyces radicis]|uniref:DoxX family protein n=1 Tax=Streptomyces radicis TaxID=1750517 RepID=A0A3A9WJI2_9ACTN|nr:DoxX family protein [Streptomyces radicis]RKN12493.1 DoxX family protein [Streptomyces radicis]RKN27739.1 DoxX family protein [Streptomyces radicis]
MFIAYVIVGIALALMLTVSGRTKLARDERIVEGITGLGVPLGWFPFLAASEIAGAIGLVVGIWWAPIGIAAAIGVTLYFVGAVGAHLRKGDIKGLPPAAVLLLAAVATLALRAASA